MKVEDLLKEFEEEQTKLKKGIKAKSQIKNSNSLNDDSWTAKVTAKVKISELASEFGVEECCVCHYGISFDDDRGWFICNKAKYSRTCDFKGNIVNFLERVG